MRSFAQSLAILLISALAACSPSTSKKGASGKTGGGGGGTVPSDDGAIRAIVSVPPQAEIIRRIGGEHVVVDILVGEGQDPHTFSPTPSQMSALGEAQIMFTVGMPFESALVEKFEEAGLPLAVVDTGAGFEKLALQCDHPEHGHGEEGHDEHGHDEHHEPDPHIWLSPTFLKVQTAHIEKALAAAAPDHAVEFQQNRAALDAELDTLHASLGKQMEPYAGEQFFVFHPAFGYFGHTYGIDQVAVEINGNAPTPKELAAFIANAREKDVKVLFTQPQFDARAAETVAKALGAKVVALDPLAPDVLQNLQRVADAIASGFAG
jgi:zinc transport system substrate-binding protein